MIWKMFRFACIVPSLPGGSVGELRCICNLVRTTSCGYVVTDAIALLPAEQRRISDDPSSSGSLSVNT